MSLLPPAQEKYIQHPGFLCGPEGNAGLETDAQLQHPAERGIPQSRNFGWATAGGLFAVGARDARLGTGGCAVTTQAASGLWQQMSTRHCKGDAMPGDRRAGSAGVGIIMTR